MLFLLHCMRQLLCRFSAAGNDDLTARSDDRRPKSAKARSRLVEHTRRHVRNWRKLTWAPKAVILVLTHSRHGAGTAAIRRMVGSCGGQWPNLASATIRQTAWISRPFVGASVAAP